MTTVATIQARLAELGHSPGPIDGAWGPQTMAAVAAAIGVKAAPAAISDGEPPWLAEAHKELGVREVQGAGNSPRVVGYYAEAAHPEIQQDSVPWCAAFVGAMLKRAGMPPSGSLMARSYLSWGVPLEKPRLGCIVVLERGAAPAGHVGFLIDHSARLVRLLGGNQNDAVGINAFATASVLGYRWPKNFNLW